MYGIDVTEFYTNFGASAMRERYYLGFVVNSAHTGQYETLLKYIFSDILGVPERTNGVNAGNGNEETFSGNYRKGLGKKRKIRYN